MKLKLFYPAKPWRVTQLWGIPDPIYKQFGFSRHNGVDFALSDDKYLRAPFDGQVVKNGFQPNGGGVYVGFISQDKYEFSDGVVSYVLFDGLHMEKILANEGSKYVTGDILGIQDNTGFSTGPHTHGQFRRVQWDGITIETVDVNDANNSFDPTPYWTGRYAQELLSVVQILRQELSLYQKVVELIKLGIK